MSHRRSIEDERRLKKVFEETKNGYGPGVWYDEDKERYIRLDFTNAWLKKHTRRTTRRKLKQNKADVIINGCYYKKLYDYWWELY